MSTGPGPDENSIQILKAELKEWERVFAKNNGGRKAGREDIKRDAVIAAKYKEYKRLQTKPAEKTATSQKSTRASTKTDDTSALEERPNNMIAATPKRDTKTKQSTALLKPPVVVEEEPTPTCIRFALGPTPQKDGEVLSIFDALPAGTPSKGNDALITQPELSVAATPSRRATSSDPKLSRTPQSSGKRFFLGGFAGTPLKRKREDDENCTPSTAKRQFATPSFLRRNVPLARIDEESDIGIAAPPFKKRGLVRSLSSIIQNLKKIEEDRMDDDWDIMREIEGEESGQISRTNAPRVLVEDSQAKEMPLGPDQGPELSGDEQVVDPGSLDANGNPRKVWKKKGQKRQTKRVKMRPVTHKPKKAADAKTAKNDYDQPELVEETQNLDEKTAASDLDSDVSDNEDEGSDFDDHDDGLKNKRKALKKPKTNKSEDKSMPQDDSKDKKDRRPKKVSAQSHANFRKLKIKNKNSKAKGKGGRFGRR